MDLDELWTWKTRRLACRLRVETGNPAGDDLRERFAELGKVDLKEILAEMKNTKKKKEAIDKLATDPESDVIYKNLESRAHVLGATARTLQDMETYDEAHKESLTQQNINKVFSLLPKSPSKRLLKEIQRERAKPLKLPNQDGVSQAQLKLQRRLQRERALKKAELEGALIQVNDQKENQYGNSLSKKSLNTVFPPYSGDHFGSGGEYMESMLYLSRTADAVDKTSRYVPPENDDRLRLNSSVNIAADSSGALDKPNEIKGKEENGDYDSTADLTLLSIDQSTNKEIDMKLYCAVCLCDWARDPLNSHRLAEEGAVKAISQLILETNIKIVYFCVAAFSYMSEHEPLVIKMIDDGVVAVIGEMIQTYATDEFILSNLAMTMVNLTRHGHEAQLVEGGIIMALINTMGMKNELSMLCARGLYNLSCVDTSYHNIERLIRALVSISLTVTSLREKHIIAASFCNLSDLKLVRSRLVEEGVVNTLGLLAKGSEQRTRRICAIVLQNLSASKSIRVDIVSRNGVSVAYGLSSDEDPIILRAIALTLSRLTKEKVNNPRIVTENGITAVTNITILAPKAANISQPLAMCYRYLTQHGASRSNLVLEAGGVGAIGVVLRSSIDNTTIQNTLISLANLLVDKDAHISILQQGLLQIFIELAKRENEAIRDILTLVLLQFTCYDTSHRALVNNKVAQLICDLARNTQGLLSKRRCAIALCRLSYYSAGIPVLAEQDVIPTLKLLLDTGDRIAIHNACAALCRLCCNEGNCIKILGNLIVSSLVEASTIDIETNQYCLAVLSMLSYYECSRSTLIEIGIMSVLKSSAQINDDLTNQRCLLTYANLSCEPSAHERMVEDGVIKVASLLAESYHEINYVCCAKVMCNLACNPAVCDKIAKQGGVYALLMISIVHSVDNETKLLCVMALNNLLREQSVDTLLQEGIISAMVRLSKIDDQRIVLICAKILNQLSLYSNGRGKIAEKPVNIHILMDIANNTSNRDAQIIASRTACNMVLDPLVRRNSLDFGLIGALEKGIKLNDDETTLLILRAIYSACSDENHLKLIASGTLPSYISIAGVGRHQGSDFFFLSVDILEELALSKVSRAYLQNLPTAGPIIRLITKDLHKDSVTSIIKIIRLIVNGYSNHAELIDLGLLQAILTIYTVADNEGLLMISQIYRILCTSDNCVEKIANAQVVDVLTYICNRLEGNANCMTNLVIILLAIQRGENDCYLKILLPCISEIICKSCMHQMCHEYAIAFLGLVLGEIKSRFLYQSREIISMVHDIMLLPLGESIAYNCTRVIFYLGTNSASREVMISAEFQMDMALNKLQFSTTSAKVKAGCSVTGKKLSVDSGGSIEEGIVSQMIFNALDHNKKKKDDDSIIIPIIPLLAGSFIWTGTKPMQYDGTGFQWSCEFPTLVGGSAAHGPEPPDPPPYEAEDTDLLYTQLTEELEVETDSKTKMAFAKMTIPMDFRTKYSFSDKQFKQARSSHENADDASSKTPEGAEEVETSIELAKFADGAEHHTTLAEGSLLTAGVSDGSLASGASSNKSIRRKSGSNRPASESSVRKESKGVNRAPSPINLVGRQNSRCPSMDATPTTDALAPLLIPSNKERTKSASNENKIAKNGIASEKLAAKLSLYN